MSEFIQFRDAVNAQIKKMEGLVWYVTRVSNEALWNTYLGSFPEGTNPLYITKTEHDCNCCRQFIQALGNVVSFAGEKRVTIWDIEIGGTYQVVADALASLVRDEPITDTFTHFQKNVGQKQNFSIDAKAWDHFYAVLPAQYVNPDPGTMKSELHANVGTLRTACEEFSMSAVEAVLEVIPEVYRGEEQLQKVSQFKEVLAEYLVTEKKDDFFWKNAATPAGKARFKNSAIGAMVENVSKGMTVEMAVSRYETMVAPQNYKRSSALITPGMKEKAAKKILDMGLSDSLQRRYAVESDITINNVLYADRSVQTALGVPGVIDILESVVTAPKVLPKHLPEMSITEFLEGPMSEAESLEVWVDAKHNNNFVSLIAPVNADALGMLKWKNNFSWSYKGEVTDSMKERVKKAGGNVTGVLRFSIQWNESGDDNNDLDAHCIEPDGNKIYFRNAKKKHPSSGSLDVDIRVPEKNVAVENIIYTDLSKMKPGNYEMLVHNFHHRGGRTGVRAELEFGGVTHSFNYPKNIPEDSVITVAIINISESKEITIVSSLPTSITSSSHWGIPSEGFHRVSMVMLSPNYWDGQAIGNKHWFFMLQNCANPDETRGFYNEFLHESLHENRKVFEVLASKMKTPIASEQLSGLGFSSTQRNSLVCRTTGKNPRIFKINF